MGREISEGGSLDDVDMLCEHTMDILSRISGYTSIMARGDMEHQHEKIVCRGTRYFLEQPEFADYGRLKVLLFALEEKIRELQTVMLSNLDEGIKIMVGDEMGLDAVAGCSLVVSGSREPRWPFVMALLGPVRMDYIKAATSLYSLKQRLTEMVKRLP
jgi:heat-inducible transcriptional repressor